mmetsp:Transcript_9321/g.21312  ORF Transcript_9321/g.21312 Transcript_9321/m.21312 type:complete len:127 (+) Transcript_9321:84-464(+)
MVAPRTALVFWSVFFPRNAAALSIHRHRIKAATGARESRNDLSFFGSSSFVGVVRRANKDGGVRGIVSALEGGQLGNGNNNNNNNDDDDSNNDPYGWAGLGGKGLERFTAIRMVDGVALLCYRKKL